ncbi:hypothetical protein CPB85DRAFT_1332947 [Mucidula mucida]|nr:hypothetical protein CPB85DRAFT_1332947 [Mucidula mucida]
MSTRSIYHPETLMIRTCSFEAVPSVKLDIVSRHCHLSLGKINWCVFAPRRTCFVITGALCSPWLYVCLPEVDGILGSTIGRQPCHSLSAFSCKLVSKTRRPSRTSRHAHCVPIFHWMIFHLDVVAGLSATTRSAASEIIAAHNALSRRRRTK